MKKLLVSLVLGAGAFRIGCQSVPGVPACNRRRRPWSFNFQGGITGKVHPNIALGAGFGITEKWNFGVRR